MKAKFITMMTKTFVEQKTSQTYNAFKEGNLWNRICGPEFGLIIGDSVNNSVTNLTIILIPTSPQLKVNIRELFVDLKKVLIKYLLSSSCNNNTTKGRNFVITIMFNSEKKKKQFLLTFKHCRKVKILIRRIYIRRKTQQKS